MTAPIQPRPDGDLYDSPSQAREIVRVVTALEYRVKRLEQELAEMQSRLGTNGMLK